MLEAVLGLDVRRDHSEIARLQLEPVTPAFTDGVRAGRYQAAGFEIVERGVLPAAAWAEFKTTWAKRLKGKETRPITYVIARAV